MPGPLDPGIVRSPGSRVGHYEIVRELGRGGMGVVYEATDLKLERRVAIKSPLVRSPVVVKRFLREGRAASQLSHPHIVPVHDVFDEDGVPFLVMEFIPGGSLGDLIARAGPLPQEDVLRHAEALAEALSAAHAKGILHRDIKPGNVLVDERGQARLADFGLVRFLEDAGARGDGATRSLSITAGGTRVGTFAYMSPEQMLGKPLGPPSDIFSLGAVIYEMCTGRRAFPSDTEGGILDAVLHTEPDAIARFNYALPPDVDRIVRRTLAKRPDERYQTAADLAADLRALRRKTETGDSAVSYHTAPPPPPPVRHRRVTPTALGVAAVVVALVALAAWWALRGPAVPPMTSLGATRQLTVAPGWEKQPALSPDGGFVAYVSNAGGNADVFVIDSGGGEPLQLTDDPAHDRSPAWFPDSREIAFVSGRGHPAIWKKPRLGGGRVLLVENADYPAISPDGRRIAFSAFNEYGEKRIAVAPLDDPGRVRVLTGADDGLWDHTHPRWSPDGTTLCYADFRDLWLVPIAGGAARPVTREHATDREPVWSPDGRFVYFSSLREGTLALWWTPVAGGAAQRLTPGTGPERHPSLSADGRRIAYSTFGGDADVVLLDRASGETFRLASLSTEFDPTFAPDGRGVAFTSDRRGRWDLWYQPLVDGRPAGPPRLVMEQAGTVSQPTFSPDGRFIAYLRIHDDRRDLWVVAADGGVPVRLTDHAAVDIHPAWSPDGRHVAFVSDRAGQLDVWLLPVAQGAATGPPVPLTHAAAEDTQPAWSPDGSQVAFVRASREVWVAAVPPREAAPRSVVAVPTAMLVRWEVDGTTLLVNGIWGTGEQAGAQKVRPIALRDGSPAGPALGVDFGDPQDGSGQFQVSRNGQWLVYVEENMRGDVWVSDAGGPRR